MPTKPSINTSCVASHYASAGERIAEVFAKAEDGHAQAGCLLSVRRVENAGKGHRGLVIEVYRADTPVFVRINGRDYHAASKGGR